MGRSVPARRFRTVAELMRTMEGIGGVAISCVDGLAAISVSSSLRRAAPGVAAGPGAAGGDQRLHAPLGSLLGHGSRRSASESVNTSANAVNTEVNPAAFVESLRFAAAGGDVAVFRQPELGILLIARILFVCLLLGLPPRSSPGRELPIITDLARARPTVVNISTTQVRERALSPQFRIVEEDDPLYDFFRRFIPAAGSGGQPADSRAVRSLGLHHQHRRLRLTNAHVVVPPMRSPFA